MPRYIDVDALSNFANNQVGGITANHIMRFPTADVEPVRHGRWIECDYKKLEHGFLETYPKAGLCCSVCRTGFEKKKMTYKQHCPHCGAKMDGDENK